ncbi:hypothetical protein OKW21_004981 [Catalinimonas alkaloidigena]|uniref:hypothetical protein n=1 Tax=Catalinimonas alkaloidigena TaxID=1075417 RepID=UPI002406783D|nr:hypothetical protein [Catalinimonas alkaloidigena]MDF9799718.1 hypothetical protein [Catalinimonas alkaloidigena]
MLVNTTIFRLKKENKFLYFIMIQSCVAVLINLSLQFVGLHSFTAAKYVNYSFVGIFLIFYYKEFIYSILKTYCGNILLLYFIYGLIRGNPLIFVLSDFFLLCIPVTFYVLAKQKNITFFVKQYLILFELLLIPIILCRFLFSYNFYFDYNVLLVFFLFYIVDQKYYKAIIIFLVLIYVYSVGKIFFIQLTIILVSFLIFNRKTFLVSIAIFVIGILILNLQIKLQDFKSTSEGLNKVYLLINSFDYKSLHLVNRLSEIPSYAFYFLDPSTAQRVYEFFLIVQKSSLSFIQLFFGQGLGGYVSMNNTGDSSVVIAHQGNMEIKVFHLGISYVLCKFGLLGIITSILSCIYILSKAFINNVRAKTYANKFTILYLLVVLVGISFTFSNYVKLPLFAICINHVLNYKKRGYETLTHWPFSRTSYRRVIGKSNLVKIYEYEKLST